MWEWNPPLLPRGVTRRAPSLFFHCSDLHAWPVMAEHSALTERTALYPIQNKASFSSTVNTCHIPVLGRERRPL